MGAQSNDHDGIKKDGLTRRGFFQIMGTGVVGASLSGAALAVSSQPAPPEKILDAKDTVKIKPGSSSPSCGFRGKTAYYPAKGSLPLCIYCVTS